MFCLKEKKKPAIKGTDRFINKRRYDEALVYVPRKNGKSMLCSALVIAYFILDEEKGKEVVSVAGSSDQAALIFDPIYKSLKERTSPLNHPSNTNPNCKFKLLKNPRKVISANELNSYKPLTADGERNHGLNVSFAIMDELHTWKEKQGMELYEAIETSMGMREDPFHIVITTAATMGDNMCNRKFEFASSVSSGLDDTPHFLPVLYYIDTEQDWEDEKNWYDANPQLGKSITIEYLRRKKDKYKKEGLINKFKRLHLNIQTKTANKFLDFNKWRNCEYEKDMDFAGIECFGGLDLAFKSDLCAFVLEFNVNGIYHIMSKFWIPEEHKEISFYKEKGWIESGEIVTTEGNAIDFKKVRLDIVEMCKPFNIVEIGYDPKYASELVQTLNDEHDLPMVEVSQSPAFLSEALKDIAASIPNDKFRHDGNDCFTWQVGNATSKEVGDLIKLVKPSGKDRTLLKVDAIAALSMSHNRTLFNLAEDMGALLSSDEYSMF